MNDLRIQQEKENESLQTEIKELKETKKVKREKRHTKKMAANAYYVIIYVQRTIHDKWLGYSWFHPSPILRANWFLNRFQIVCEKTGDPHVGLERTYNELNVRSLLVQAHYSRRRQLVLFSCYLLAPEALSSTWRLWYPKTTHVYTAGISVSLEMAFPSSLSSYYGYAR